MGMLFDRSLFSLGLAAALSAPLQACHGGATPVPATPSFPLSHLQQPLAAGSCSATEVPAAGTNGTFNGVAAFSSTSAFAAGSQTSGTLFESWNGVKWMLMTSPNPGTVSNVFNGVGGSKHTNVFIVGSKSNSTLAHNKRTLIMHFDGITLKVPVSPNKPTAPGGSTFDNVLNGVAAHSPTDAMAVGTYQKSDGTSHVLSEHWNGIKWSIVPTPDLAGTPGTFSTLTGISTSGPNNYVAVGYFGTSPTATFPFALAWTGTKWNQILSTTTFSPNTSLTSVNGLAANDLWVTGATLTTVSNGVAAHFTGTWTPFTLPSPVLGKPGQQPVGIAELSATNVFVAENDFTSTIARAAALHYNGTSWLNINVGDPGTTDSYKGASSIPGTTRAWGYGNYTPHAAEPVFPKIDELHCP